MITFERLLREQHGTYCVGTPSTSRFVCGPTTSTFVDDVFGSISGAILFRARQAYPEYERFHSGSFVQGDNGVDIARVVSGFDGALFGSVVQILVSNNPDYYRAAVDDYNKYTALLGAPGTSATAPYFVFDAIRQIFILMRLDSRVSGYPFEQNGDKISCATSDELVQVMSGMLCKSIKLPAPSRTVLDSINGLFANAGTISDDSTELCFYTRFDPFVIVGSKACALPVCERIDGFIAPPPTAVVPPTVGEVVTEVAPESSTVKPSSDPIIALIKKYTGVDYSSLSPDDKIEAYFGSRAGQSAWLKLSQPARKNFTGQFAANVQYPLDTYLEMATDYINSRNPKHGITLEQLRLLAAGCIVSYGTVFRYCDGDPPYVIKM